VSETLHERLAARAPLSALMMCAEWFEKWSPTVDLIGDPGRYAVHPMLEMIRNALDTGIDALPRLTYQQIADQWGAPKCGADTVAFARGVESALLDKIRAGRCGMSDILETLERLTGKDRALIEIGEYWSACELAYDEIDRLTRELEEAKRIANDHRNGRLAALERIAKLESRAVPEGMTDRIDAAIKRIVDGHAPRRIPADVTDVDLVLAEVRAWINGKWPPFWLVEYPSTTPPTPAEGK
jgi:hypothetical protein